MTGELFPTDLAGGHAHRRCLARIDGSSIVRFEVDRGERVVVVDGDASSNRTTTSGRVRVLVLAPLMELRPNPGAKWTAFGPGDANFA
jgi:hypothetical protein